MPSSTSRQLLERGGLRDRRQGVLHDMRRTESETTGQTSCRVRKLVRPRPGRVQSDSPTSGYVEYARIWCVEVACSIGDDICEGDTGKKFYQIGSSGKPKSFGWSQMSAAEKMDIT
jgi:hypothetical protein